MVEESSLLSDFFRYIFGETIGWLCIGTESSVKGDFRQRFFQWPLEESQLLAYINKEKSKKNVWFCVNLLVRKERKKEACKPSTVLWADLDDCSPDTIDPKPQIVIESSPNRYQALWKVDVPLDPQIAEDYSRRIYGQYKDNGVDAGWALTKFLRVPFTDNLKYKDRPKVKLVRALEGVEYEADLFDQLSYERREEIDVEEDDEIPDLQDAEPIIGRHQGRLLEKGFSRVWGYEPKPGDDRSGKLWNLINICLESGLSKEETYSVAYHSSVNKYRLDGRPDRYLWRDVKKAATQLTSFTVLADSMPFQMPELIPGDKYKVGTSIVERYIKWGESATDATPRYHELSIYMVLSALLAGNLKLDTSFGTIFPNLWGLILGDSTLTRKAQPLDSKVLTPDGWRMMGELRVGDEVIGSNGQPTEVLGIYPQGQQESYKVTFGDGACTECSKDHLWAIRGRGIRQRKYGVWSLQKLMERGLKSSNQWCRQIPLVRPVEFPEIDLPLDPYVLGVILGDGTLSSDGSVRITSIDDEIIEAVRKECERHDLRLKYIGGSYGQYQLSSGHLRNRGRSKNPITLILRDLNLQGLKSFEKFVPEIYLHGSIEQRLALLQGLMDTDGWTSIKKDMNFASSSPQLADAVQYLTRSLGGWSKRSSRDNGKFKRIEYASVSLPMGMVPFRLTRKASYCNDRTWIRPQTMRSIDFVGIKEMQCIKVAAEDGLYVTDNFVVTHNTTAMRMAVDIIEFCDKDIILATDGSAEGIVTGLSLRPGRTSMFFRDEVVGLMDSIRRKDWLAGIPQLFTQLYDGTSVRRMLRKETITVSSPIYLFFGGGIRDQFYVSVDESFVYSGFLPRFLIVSGVTDRSKLRPLGPPTPENMEERQKIYSKCHELYHSYMTEADVQILGQPALEPAKTVATMTNDAYALYGEINSRLIEAAYDSPNQTLALPTFERLAMSLLKMALLNAAARQEPDDFHIEVSDLDIRRAAKYVQEWGWDTIDIISNVGQTVAMRTIDRANRYVIEHPGVTRSSMMRALNLTKRQMIEIEETLEARGEIRILPQGKGRIYEPAEI